MTRLVAIVSLILGSIAALNPGKTFAQTKKEIKTTSKAPTGTSTCM